MNKITFPLGPRMEGAAVAALQDALKVLLERSVILADNAMARRGFPAALQNERDRQTYGSATSKLISMVQEERRLEPTGEVDERTARVLNELLKELGVLDPGPASSSYIVSGVVRREDGLPLQGLRVRAAHELEQHHIRLGEDSTDAAGHYTIRYDPLPGVKAIHL